MAIHIIESTGRREKRGTARYLKEIRELSKAGLTRRDLFKMGLVMSGAGLLALRATRTGAQPGTNPPTSLMSPPNTPFVDPLPIPPILQPTTLDPLPTKGPNPFSSTNSVVIAKGAGPVTPFGFVEAGRPDHQRWTEFGGASDGPGFDGPQFESIAMPVKHDFYPTMDGVPPSTIWTYVEAATGKVGPLRINARYGQPIIHRIHNALPEENGGFGINQITTHLHNGHHASESDGGPNHFYDARLFKDYHFPNVRAGFASTHPSSSFNGIEVPGDVLETMSFLWFHDHREMFTAANVYKGLVSFYTLFSDDIGLDTGDETTGLRLPSGEFDIPMIFGDKAFDPTTGELFFDQLPSGFPNPEGFLGDKFAVNGKLQPFLEVRRRRYRFRFLDGGPSRVFEFFLSNGKPFIQISNDGNLLPRALSRKSIRLGVAERVDVIVDFTNTEIGDRIYLQNRLEQLTGRGPTGKIIEPADLVEFRVVGDATDESRDLKDGDELLPLPDQRAPAQTRRFHFERSNGAWAINGKFFEEDEPRFSVPQNSAEVWTLTSGNGWQHPIHIHMEEFQLLSRNGKPVPKDEIARKDVVRIGQNAVGHQNTGEAKLFIQFRDFHGDYPMHCHNVVHEDDAMMLLFEVEEE